MMALQGDLKDPVSQREMESEKKRPLAPGMEISTALENAPTYSHALATQDHEEKGVAQLKHDEPGVKNLGWDRVVDHQPELLVGGLSNEKLRILIRRFNHVRFPCFARLN
jgi:hypothetical protein